MCHPSEPCLGVLREILVASTFRVDSCGNGHHFRTETPWAGGTPVRAIDPEEGQTGACLQCGTPIVLMTHGRKRRYCSKACIWKVRNARLRRTDMTRARELGR